MSPPPRNHRIGIVHASLALLAVAVVGKAVHVQLVQGDDWAAAARRQHFSAREVPAPRGLILDASGAILATSRELVKLDIAPREVRDSRALRRALVGAGVDEGTALRAVDRKRQWAPIPDRFVAEDVAAISAMRGVYTTPVSDRTYSATGGLRALLGRVDPNGNALDGLELTLDTVLRGTRGASQLGRDSKGRMISSPTQPGLSARRGHSVMLTINHELQEIAERSLADAVQRMDAEGGDIVILDPKSGDVLAMAGLRVGVVAPAATGVTEPFEPGSTLKPLIAAALLQRGKVRSTDKVPGRGGTYTLHGRTIHDEPHAAPTPSQLTLADVIRLSSNIGIVQFADRLAPREQFETLRDFGLGMPTGLPYSAEAAGTLRPPTAWSKQSMASLSMGYELAVTPLQLALAYAAIANGGELVEPVLVKEIRTVDGELTYRGERRVIRRVISPQVASSVRKLMSGVVEGGTAVDADLATFQLAGKTGTPRRTIDGKYEPRQYNPNFVGLFPADAPQLVIVVKLTSPKGNYYGGATAAPVTKTILEAALASRDAALDRSRLNEQQKLAVAPRQSGKPRAAVATARRVDGSAPVIDSTRSVVLHLPAKPARKRGALPPRVVPNVRGMSLRSAVRSLHSAGFRVQLARDPSAPTLTEPAPGTLTTAGSLVRLRYSR
jgi:cell division protein FtsI (penicillin-binding protein 3)